jgi:hypothetical protein
VTPGPPQPCRLVGALGREPYSMLAVMNYDTLVKLRICVLTQGNTVPTSPSPPGQCMWQPNHPNPRCCCVSNRRPPRPAAAGPLPGVVLAGHAACVKGSCCTTPQGKLPSCCCIVPSSAPT